jgi:hypothetical protein
MEVPEKPICPIILPQPLNSLAYFTRASQPSNFLSYLFYKNVGKTNRMWSTKSVGTWDEGEICTCSYEKGSVGGWWINPRPGQVNSNEYG